jgi:hypothetical protein
LSSSVVAYDPEFVDALLFGTKTCTACGFPALALCGHVVRPWLVRRLALRTVFVALDYEETGREKDAVEACRALAALGATPYRLAPPAGDWADHLQAVGLKAMRAELAQALKTLG